VLVLGEGPTGYVFHDSAFSRAMRMSACALSKSQSRSACSVRISRTVSKSMLPSPEKIDLAHHPYELW